MYQVLRKTEIQWVTDLLSWLSSLSYLKCFHTAAQATAAYYRNNVTCIAQTNTNLLELELNDSETSVSRIVYLISVANS